MNAKSHDRSELSTTGFVHQTKEASGLVLYSASKYGESIDNGGNEHDWDIDFLSLWECRLTEDA